MTDTDRALTTATERLADGIRSALNDLGLLRQGDVGVEWVLPVRILSLDEDRQLRRRMVTVACANLDPEVMRGLLRRAAVVAEQQPDS
jgi:hypothetical protein